MKNNDAELLNFFRNDFDLACKGLKTPWQDLKRAKIFLTGGTGFFGSWLLRAIQWANTEWSAEIQITVLSRDPESFIRKRPEFKNLQFLTLLKGDIQTFEFPDQRFTHIIHAATAASASLNAENPLLMLDTITQGTRRALEFSVLCGAKRFLLTSSGAIYGKQPSDLSHIAEDYMGGPDPLSPASAYGEGKRYAEHLCSLYSKQFQLETIIARCFALAGPYLPWDIHFAIGNFLKDGLEKKHIRIKGDGTPLRSYLYGAELGHWLLTLLGQGQSNRAYNVGSENAYSIREIAESVAQVIEALDLGKVTLQVDTPVSESKGAAHRYIPKTERIRNELKLNQHFDLHSSIRRSILWYDLAHSF